MKVDGRVNRNGTDSKNITESGMSFSQNLGFQLLHNLDFLCSESKIASLTRLTFARPERETCSISVQSAADADKFNQIRLWMEN